jgi:hypothetical protein
MDNIKVDLVEIGCGGVDWIGLAQDRDNWRAVSECGKVPSDSIKWWESTEWLHN